MSDIRTLPGFREFYPEDRAVLGHLMNVWRQACRRYGFREWESPVLEPLELFTEKSGEEIVRHEPQPAVAARERAEKMFLVLEEHRDRLGPRRTGLHPRFERGDVSLGQLFLRRHREVFRRVTHGLEQQTFLRVARHERGAVLAALERRCA